MKKINRNVVFKGFILLTTISLLLVSCNQDNLSVDTETDSQIVSKAETQTEIDNISEGLNDIGEDIFLVYENLTAAKNSDTKKDFEGIQIPDCLIITKVITNTNIDVTLDYGEGCLNRNDNFLSGKILMSIGFDFAERAITIDYTFDNFYFNNKKVEGEIYINRIRINENGFPQAIINKDIKITWEDGAFVTVKGERKREWVEGFDNDVWGDNVFLITGIWTVTHKDGTNKTVTIIEPLKRKTACRFIVSGVVEIQENERVISVNYGNGECDDLAIATFNGADHEIHLRNRN